MSQPASVERQEGVGADERVGERTTDRSTAARATGAVDRRPALALPAASDRDDVLGEDEFAVLYPALHRFACVTADLDLDPDDLVQEALVRFLRVRATRAIDRPDAYLRRSIVNLVMSHRRRAGTGRTLGRRLRAPDERSDVYPSDLAGVLDGVSPLDRALLTMTAIEGMAVGEAAEVLGLSSAAARARLSRAKRALRTEVRP